MPYAKHETFHIREGWLFKGMDAVRHDQRIFMGRDASERLGLGRNMVRALRFWMTATGLTEEYRENQRTTQRLTDPFGQLVWEHDRYLEEEGTLWLIHYHLVRDQGGATAWYWFFSYFSQPVFDQSSFVSALQSWVIGVEGKAISENSLKRDFDCLVRTYLPDRQARSPEDLMECPLAQLGLLAEANSGRVRRYRLLRPDPASIDSLVLLYVLLRWQEGKKPDSRQVGLAQVLREPANAGRVFNMGTAGLSDALTRLNDEHHDLAVRLTRTAGLDELTLPLATAEEVLIHYYETRR
ncbi:MAG: DUF4007 family protein [Anaerolineales bacterium]|nr:MAG: DUF4007 family protein [Anaerolineales bacterium]